MVTSDSLFDRILVLGGHIRFPVRQPPTILRRPCETRRSRIPWSVTSDRACLRLLPVEQGRRIANPPDRNIQERAGGIVQSVGPRREALTRADLLTYGTWLGPDRNCSCRLPGWIRGCSHLNNVVRSSVCLVKAAALAARAQKDRNINSCSPQGYDEKAVRSSSTDCM